MILVISPWTIRNYYVSNGEFIPVNSQGREQLIWIVADGNFKVKDSLSEPVENAVSIQKSGLLFSYGNLDGITHLTEVNNNLLRHGLSVDLIYDELGKTSIYYLLKHPEYIIRQTIRGILLLMSPYASIFGKSIMIRVLATVLFHIPLLFGLIVGTLHALVQKNASISIISLFTAAYLLIHAPAAVGGGRYTVPVIPLLIIVSIYGVEWIIDQNGKLSRLISKNWGDWSPRFSSRSAHRCAASYSE